MKHFRYSLIFSLFLFFHFDAVADIDSNNYKVAIDTVVKKMREKIKRAEVSKVKAVTKRGEDTANCYPQQVFQFPYWPMNNSTFLAHQPILIREELTVPRCAISTVIVLNADDGNIVHSQKIKSGELAKLEVELEPDRSYDWYILGENHARSESYTFSILSESESMDLKHLENSVSKVFPELDESLAKALFYQDMSNHNLNLYGESMKFLEKYSTTHKEYSLSIYNYLVSELWFKFANDH